MSALIHESAWSRGRVRVRVSFCLSLAVVRRLYISRLRLHGYWAYRVRLSSRTFVTPRAISQQSVRTSVTSESIQQVSLGSTPVSLERAHVPLGRMRVFLGHGAFLQDVRVCC